MKQASLCRSSIPRFKALNEIFDRCGLRTLEYFLPVFLLWVILLSPAYLS